MSYYEIKKTRLNNNSYIYKTKNEFNQIIELEIYKFGKHNITINWGLILYFGKRKDKIKSFEHCNSTGKDGIKSLVWTKKCLEDFIIFLSQDKSRKHTIFVYALNSKRMRVYIKGLQSLNFKKGQNFLYKHINN